MLAAIAEYSNVVPVTLVKRDGHPARVRAAVGGGDYFEVIGLAPVSGRVVSARDDGAAADPVAVLSYGFWVQRFGGAPGVVGSAPTA